MGRISEFLPEKLICGVLVSKIDLVEDTVEALTRLYGEIDFRTGTTPFSFTDYYNREMGTPIYRFFVSFEELVLPDVLSEVKLATNSLEDGFTSGCKGRPVNIDPGLISLQRLILASTKDNGRRIPLSRGIYAEITLVYVDGDYRPVEWTYPDYRSRAYRDIMKDIRDMYKRQLKHLPK